MDIIARRIGSVADAHKVPGAAPNWKMARHYTGSSTGGDVAAPGLRSYGLKKFKDEQELSSVKFAGLYGQARSEESEAGHDGAGPAKAKAKAKVKTKAVLKASPAGKKPGEDDG